LILENIFSGWKNKYCWWYWRWYRRLILHDNGPLKQWNHSNPATIWTCPVFCVVLCSRSFAVEQPNILEIVWFRRFD
jgi:hypothetical protein